MTLYPLIFDPILKHKVWGGRTLESWGKTLPDGAIGESWELADLPDGIEDGRSRIANGPLAGRTLRDVISHHADQLLGGSPLDPAGGFPLLIKFLDACDNLSVQVHPDDAYLARHPDDDDAHLKSEAWVILEAKPDAVIYKGVHTHVDRDAFRRHVEDGSVVDDLIAIPVKAGDCHYLPSGTCHALGAGILVAEVQTPSDTTYRVFDWGRTDRELHLDQALECIHFGDAPAEPCPGTPISSDGITIEPLVSTPYFRIERLTYDTDHRETIVATEGPLIWVITDGSIEVTHPAMNALALQRGSTLLIPAVMQDAHARFACGSEVLRIQLPSPLENLHV